MKLTQEALKSILDYDPLSGIFTWLENRSTVKIGQRAGTISSRNCCRQISIDGKTFKEHQLAFLYMEGWIPLLIDHKNNNPLDNRWTNLRVATKSQNAANSGPRSTNTSGYKGVYFHKQAKKWSSQITCNRKVHSLGLFDTPEEAYAAYSAKATELHGDFVKL
jgi:hypothetical protein